MSNYTITLSDGVTQFTVYANEVDGGLSTARSIAQVDVNTQSFVIHGDLTYRFVGGFQFDVVGSGNLDGTYTVSAGSPGGSFYSAGNNTTTIFVDEVVGTGSPPVTGLPYGNIVYSIPATTDLSLPGRGTLNYGEHVVTNFVHLLENFASTVQPANPLKGQLWFNATDNTFYQFDGSVWGVLNANYIAQQVQTVDELSELTDVDVTLNGGPNDGDLLRYNSSTSAWENHQQTYERFISGVSQTVFATSIPVESNVSGGSARLQVFVNGVYQLEGIGSPPDGSYIVTGPNEITFTSPVPDNSDVVIYSL